MAAKKKSKSPASEQPAAASSGDGRELIGLEEAIELLKTTRPTFYRWLKTGKLKGLKAGRQWRFHREDLERFMQGEAPRETLPTDIGPLLKQLREYAKRTGRESSPASDEGNLATAVNLMILEAVAVHASDIHLEGTTRAGFNEAIGRLRFRVDGALQAVAEFDLRLLKPLIERWKRLAHCDLNVNNLPQDGRIELKVRGRTLDIRVSFVPGLFGEGLTARLLDPSQVALDLERVDFAPADRARIERLLKLPWGMVLCTGPAGSGKTTVLYACLKRINSPDRKVISIENPVEYLIPGVVQLQVRGPLTFPVLMRSALRGDPNVLLIGELRDQETVQVAMEAALTGHLVLSSMHTDEAASALIRLCDIGIDPFVIAESVKLIVAQRLVRKLCAECKRKAEPAPHLLEQAMRLARTGGLNWGELPPNFHAPGGCKACNQTGYRYRTVIAETLEVTGKIAGALMRRASADELRMLAVGEGMTTFIADGIRRAALGETTLEEVLRHAHAE
ncbi:MAG: ATPase, T2SS/T4P/T4SS family [Planctomycetota bacterium]|nr:ATPase, T2SS/T4P/T4SS family [Planctomycetota bacterium]